MAEGRSSRSRGSDALPDDVGQRLRRVRELRGLSLRELSRRLEISPSALSQIETGRTRPSVMTLYAMVTELDMSLDDLLRSRADGERAPRGPPTERPPAPRLDAPPVLSRDGRRTIDLGAGVRWERLTALADDRADFLFVTYEVGASTSWEPIARRHGGREYGLLLTGHIRVVLDLDAHEMLPNDSIVFDTSIPHRVDNIGSEPATAVWCMVGPTPE